MIQQQVKGYSKEEERKETRMNDVTILLVEIEELSSKIACEMKEKKEVYFGESGLEAAEGTSGYRENNGMVDKMLTNLDNIKINLLRISKMIDSF